VLALSLLLASPPMRKGATRLLESEHTVGCQPAGTPIARPRARTRATTSPFQQKTTLRTDVG